MKTSMTPGGKDPRPPRKERDKVPAPPSRIPWPVRRDSEGGCFPKGGIPGKPAPGKPRTRPPKPPTPNRRGR